MDYSSNCQTFVSGDDLFVDDFLDLSNGFPEDEGDENKPNPPENKETVTNKSPIPSVKQDFGELSLPVSLAPSLFFFPFCEKKQSYFF